MSKEKALLISREIEFLYHKGKSFKKMLNLAKRDMEVNKND